MKAPVIKVLLVDDASKHARLMRDMLQAVAHNSIQLAWVDSIDLALSQLAAQRPEVMLLDLGLALARGANTVAELQQSAPRMAVIMLSSLDDEEAALRAVHQGAQDYLVKSEVTGVLLTRSIRYAIERKGAEMALLQAEEKYRGIFENTLEGIFQTTPAGQYLSANPALARIYGYGSPAELMAGLTNIGGELYVEPRRREEFITLMERDGVVRGFESRVYRKDRSIIWISENVRAVRDASRRLLYYEGTVEDITQRQQQEEELSNSEALYHSLVETLPQNIFRKNLAEQFTFANQRFCETLGRPLGEILGKTDFDFFPAALAAKYQKDDQLIKESGKAFETVEENQVGGGEKRYVNVVKTPLHDAQGRIIGLQGIFWDITEKRRAEERLRQANLELARSREELRLKNQQMEEDLRMAREIQQAIIPDHYPTVPSHASPEESLVSFCHLYLPTGVVGGDFFDIRLLSESRIGVFICDVMGHGVRSALVTAMLRALVEELTPETSDPAELLARMNHDLRAILKRSGTPLYTTAFYLVADLEQFTATYANAGHPKPIVLRAAGGADWLQNQDRSNPALGLFDSFRFTNSTARIGPGDRFVFFTDGVYDVEREGELLSPDWLRDEMVQRSAQKLPVIFEQVLAQLRSFSRTDEFLDDMCLVGMEIRNDGTSAKSLPPPLPAANS